MADCERLEFCPFFTGKIKATPNIAGLLKQMYCHSDKTQCARYQLIRAHVECPSDLLPNDVERAKTVLLARR
jgi:hypothetical protein